MSLNRWSNQTLPQTLQIGMFLLYLDAAFGVLFGGIFAFPIGTALVVASAAAGLGIANERKWGWQLGVVASAVSLLFAFLILEPLGLIFAVAQLALLLHPQSRDHQKVWFT